jgi:hypothetical protein
MWTENQVHMDYIWMSIGLWSDSACHPTERLMSLAHRWRGAKVADRWARLTI